MSGAHEGDALPHAAGELVRVAVRCPGQAEPLEQLGRPFLDGLHRQLADHALQQDVLLGGAELEQEVILERDADIGQRA